MTKKEHMVELTDEEFEDVDPEIIKKLEDDGISIGSAIENYADALRYGWTEYLHYPDVNALFQVRCFIVEEINQLDTKIDEHIEEHMQNKE